MQKGNSLEQGRNWAKSKKLVLNCELAKSKMGENQPFKVQQFLELGLKTEFPILQEHRNSTRSTRDKFRLFYQVKYKLRKNKLST